MASCAARDMLLALRGAQDRRVCFLSMRFTHGFLRNCAAAPPPLGFSTGAQPARVFLPLVAESEDVAALCTLVCYAAMRQSLMLVGCGQ